MTPTTNQVAKGQELMKRDKKKVIFVNKKGEFFYSENNAILSVNGKKDQVGKIEAKQKAAASNVKPEGTPDDNWTVNQLKQFIADNSIETDANKKADLLAAIGEWEAAKEESNPKE